MDEDEQAAGAGEAATKLAGEAAAEHVADAGVAAKLPRRCSREDVPPKLFSNGVPDDVPATGLRHSSKLGIRDISPLHWTALEELPRAPSPDPLPSTLVFRQY